MVAMGSLYKKNGRVYQLFEAFADSDPTEWTAFFRNRSFRLKYRVAQNMRIKIVMYGLPRIKNSNRENTHSVLTMKNPQEN